MLSESRWQRLLQEGSVRTGSHTGGAEPWGKHSFCYNPLPHKSVPLQGKKQCKRVSAMEHYQRQELETSFFLSSQACKGLRTVVLNS